MPARPNPRWMSAAMRLTGSPAFDAGDLTSPFPSLRPRQARGCWSFDMDYAKPADLLARMTTASEKRLARAPRDLLIRGAIPGALLGAATSLAFGAAVTTGQPLVGAIVFPVGFVMIVLLGLELVTGSFALVPLAVREGKATLGGLASNWGRVC